MTFGEKIKSARLAKKLTQQQLAEMPKEKQDQIMSLIDMLEDKKEE